MNDKKCNCDMRTRLVGDGCSVCNPELAREMSEERMTPSELRKAAEDLRAHLEITHASVGGLGIETPTQILSNKLIDHILATVREDDGEPFTRDFVTDSQMGWIGPGMLEVRNDGSVYLDCGDFAVLIDTIRTRGDFRTLCRLLGV